MRTKGTGGHLLLFIHGLGCAKECFSGAFETGHLEDFSVCALDLPGFGDSKAPVGFPYTLEEHAAAVARALAGVPASRISVIGHSMGGAVGLILTERIDRLATFVSAEGNLVAADCGLASRGLAEQSRADFMSTGRADFLDGLLNSSRSDFTRWAVWFGNSDPAALHASARSLLAWSDSNQLLKIFHGLHRKSYVYGGDESKDYLLPHISGADVYRIPRAGHFMMLDNPDAFYSTVSHALRAPSPVGG